MLEFLSYSLFEISIRDILIVLLFVFVGIIADKFSLWLINLLLKRYQVRKELLRKQKEEEERAKQSGEHPEAASNAPNNSSPSLTSLKTIQNISNVIEALKNPLHVFFVTVGCSLGLMMIHTPSWGVGLFKVITTALEAISTWCVIWFLLNLIKTVITPFALEKAKDNDIHLGDMLVPILMSIIRGILMVIGILFVAQNMGYSISSLLAGLGLGGAAIALASKDTLSNIFGSFVILFDQPFDIGDWVTIDGVSGTVEDISMRSTKVRTFDDTLVVIPNQLLTTTKIDRRGKVKTKMDCNFGVLYSTTVEQLRNIITKIEHYIESHPKEFITDKHYVHLNEFGTASLNITVVAYTNQTKYKEHVKLKEEFMFAIIEIVRASGTEFAFPTQTLDFPKEPVQISISQEPHVVQLKK